MKQTHYNRILEVINNSENTSKHLPAIRKMINNFEFNFPQDYGMHRGLRMCFYSLQRRVLL